MDSARNGPKQEALSPQGRAREFGGVAATSRRGAWEEGAPGGRSFFAPPAGRQASSARIDGRLAPARLRPAGPFRTRQHERGLRPGGPWRIQKPIRIPALSRTKRDGTKWGRQSPRSGVSSQWLKAGVRQPVGLTASTRRSRRASRRRAGEHGAPAGRSICAPVAPKARTQALPHGDARACVLAKHPARHWDATRSATSLPSFTSSTENTGESRKRSVSKIKPSQVVFSQALYSSG